MLPLRTWRGFAGNPAGRVGDLRKTKPGAVSRLRGTAALQVGTVYQRFDRALEGRRGQRQREAPAPPLQVDKNLSQPRCKDRAPFSIYLGSRTVSITWMTPLDWLTSAMETMAVSPDFFESNLVAFHNRGQIFSRSGL